MFACTVALCNIYAINSTKHLTLNSKNVKLNSGCQMLRKNSVAGFTIFTLGFDSL